MSKLTNFLSGIAVGAGIGVLLAPKKGEESRKELMDKLEDLSDYVKTLNGDKVKKDASKKLEEIKKSLEETDSEEILSKMEDKGSDVMEKLEELGSILKEKADPYAEKLVDRTKSLAVKALKEALNTLEK